MKFSGHVVQVRGRPESSPVPVSQVPGKGGLLFLGPDPAHLYHPVKRPLLAAFNFNVDAPVIALNNLGGMQRSVVSVSVTEVISLEKIKSRVLGPRVGPAVSGSKSPATEISLPRSLLLKSLQTKMTGSFIAVLTAAISLTSVSERAETLATGVGCRK